MAQCEAEGRKHPTMDLYVGIFNSKLYTSNRGSTRVGVDKWSRYVGPSAHAESFHEDAPPANKRSFQSRSFRDSNSKPPVVSDLGDFNRKLSYQNNVGSARFEMKSSIAEVGHEGIERKSPLTDVDYGVSTKSSPQADVGYVNNEKKSSLMLVGDGSKNKSSPHSEVGYGMSTKSIHGKGVGYVSSDSLQAKVDEKKSSQTEVGHGTSEKKGSQSGMWYGTDAKKNSPRTEAGYGSDEIHNSGADMRDGSIEKRVPQVDMSRSQFDVINQRFNVGNWSGDTFRKEYDVTHRTDVKIAYSDVGFGISENKATELRPAYTLQKSSQAVSEGTLQRSNSSRGTHSGIVVGTLDRPSNYSNQLNEGNLQGNAMKSQEFLATDVPLLSHGAGLSKADRIQDMAAAKRCLSSSNEFVGCERKWDSAALVNGAVSISGRVVDDSSVKSGDMNSGMVPELCNSSRHQRSGELNADVKSDTLQVRGRRSYSEINADHSNMGGMAGEKSGESIVGFPNAKVNIKAANGELITGLPYANGYIKAANGESIVGFPNANGVNKAEVDGNSQGNLTGLALKDSPSRGHNFVANLRVGGSGSTDSSSSQGGSSHSGSPTAAESTRDSRVSSFGNILISKGSPHSVSSRSMGSASISGNGVLASSKSSFNDIPAPQFRYSTSSGRKSAEIVPNRRSSEMVPNRKSSEITPNCHLRGAATQGFVGDGMFSSGNVSRGTGSLSNGNNVSLNNGNLLVGSTNGNVLSVGGGIKSYSKQGEVVNHAHTVDCTLMKKAQASSDPEEIKNAGNEYYRRGHFSEALILYNRAVSLCPGYAAYRSNRAAALSGLGRLGEAVQECENAIRLDSSHARAHQRVAALYLRLGIVERAKQHFHAVGQQTDLMEVQRLRNIDGHIFRCIEARKRGEWQNVIRESDAAVVAGADSAPQIFGYKSEALLGLHKPDEADGVCTAAQRVENSLVKAGVLPADPFLLIVRAKVEMALGRFEVAVEAAKSAAKIDPRNDNVAALLRKAQAVCHTRTTGNELFKAGRFFEALALYAEGLESDPGNAVLLCNRAACRSKLGQWEKAVEDCDAALRIQPNYTKALMRRANCWMKLERWDDALEDYELLRRKMPEDLEVARGLFDVHVAIKKSRGEDTRKMKFGGDVEEVLNDEQFQEAISSPGLSVVQFITRWSERCRQLSPFVDDLCKRNPCVNFVKVDVEDNPYLAKIESVSFIPTFKIYNNGQKVKEILGPTEQSLEYALKHYTL